ncbi:FtsX-like permease family protein [Mucilaginibacter robiniae]|uniref:FtsX-like permease family protein n=1 Tax=Mucilaginibacter robiniae TaxID=2728022 RepID=A0A7L5E066_9SPHI|nr:ABC transporter permease [Mucilaginibacter robiniae]QJD96411.1 FtsX-like permease family protein [Mucilaginibacter robiniae]
MIQLFFKTLFRNLWKNKTYSFLNIFGLAMGIACASLIFLWVENEISFDQQYSKRDRLYRIMENQAYDGSVRTFGSTPAPMGPAMKTEISGIANTCRMDDARFLFSRGDKALYEQGVYADPSVFNMFTIEFVQGNAQTAFRELYSVVITQKMARQFFGSENQAVGKMLRVNNERSYVVSGVIKDVPSNSTLQFDWLAPFEITYKQRIADLAVWGNNSVNTYVELQPGASPDAVNKQLYGYIQTKASGAIARPLLFSMNDWHLRQGFENGKQAGGRIQYIRMFTFIAWIILLIACINFMNLATARSEKRAKEVGVRKVLGAVKSRLITQFIGEALLMSVIAVILSVIIVVLLLPGFNQLVQQQLTAEVFKPVHMAALLVIALVCGLFSGSYPSFYLSSFNPVAIFKGHKVKSSGPEYVRKGLAVLQFSISITLIISTIIIYQQIQHVKNRELGYNRNNLVAIDIHSTTVRNFTAVKQELLNTGVIDNLGLSDYNPLSDGDNGSGFRWQGKDPNKEILMSYRYVNSGLIPTLNLKLKEGRDFKTDSKSDSTNIIITESLAQLLGEGSALGKTMQTDVNETRTLTFTVVGVVKDFVYGDMYGTSDPVIFFCTPSEAKYIYARIKPQADIANALNRIEGVMKNSEPAYPFVYNFVDDQFNQRFKSEALVGKLSGVFASLAIVISCLGLFGLAAYTAERRNREIGIRKVLGASVAGITTLLSKEFIQLVIIAAIIAFPIAWWSMHQWLDGYAYRITINWWVFVAAGLLAILIALLTISFQSIKAALTNPVKTLRAD